MFDRYNTVEMDDARKAIDQFADFLSNVSKTVSDTPHYNLPNKRGGR